jgi:hypothetical protein
MEFSFSFAVIGCGYRLTCGRQGDDLGIPGINESEVRTSTIARLSVLKKSLTPPALSETPAPKGAPF